MAKFIEIIDLIRNKNCKIVQLDLTAYQGELSLANLQQLRETLNENKSIRKIIWPQAIDEYAKTIDAELQKKHGLVIPGSISIEEYNKTPYFHQIIEVNAERYKDKTAVVNVDGQHTSYKQLNEQANRLAYYLIKDLKLPKGTRIAVFLNRSVNYIISIVATMKAGYTFVPIDTDGAKVSTERIDQYLKQCGAKHIITEGDQLARINNLETKPQKLLVNEILRDEKIIENNQSKSNPEIKIESDNIMYIYFSSGSTGEPKGIPIGYGSLLNRIAAHIDVLALTSSDNGAQYASIAFDASLMEITMMLAVGARLTIIPNEYRLDVRKTGEFYQNSKISVAIFVPSSLAVFNPKDFLHLRVLISTGEPVSPATIKRWREEGYKHGLRKFINGYGDTEGTIAWSLGECIDVVHIGEPIVGSNMYIFKKISPDEANKLKKQDNTPSIIEQCISPNKTKYWLLCQNIGEPGELWLAGNGLTPGYLDSTLTEKAFINHPLFGRLYRTFNVACYDLHGNYQIVDRKGRRLKIHGQFVEPQEIDNAIVKNNALTIAKTFVGKLAYKLPDNPEYNRYHLIAHVEPKENQKIDVIELYQSLRKLPRYMIPARWVIWDKLPLNNSGKIDRKKLATTTMPYVMARLSKSTQPRDGMHGFETLIQEIWSRLLDLKKDQCSIYDDFFYLGGDSLLFMQMIDKLKDELCNRDLPGFQQVSASELAINPTIVAIARSIRLEELKFEFIDYSLQRDSGDKSPLFLVPPITGDIGNAYKSFVEKIPANRPVFGLKYPGFQNILNMYEKVEDHATDCCKAILAFRNRRNISGPILLFGYSSGGVIAYEIAKQLIAKNYKVYVFIVDTIAPNFYRRAAAYQIRNLSEGLIALLTKYFSIDPKKLENTTHEPEEKSHEYITKEIDRLSTKVTLTSQRNTLEFIKNVKFAEQIYSQDPIEDIQNDSRIILLTADKTVEAIMTVETVDASNTLYWGTCVTHTVRYEAAHDTILAKITLDSAFYELLEEADNKILYTWNIPSLANDYIPRLEHTREMKALFSGKGFAKTIIAAFSGQSGCGKTMLATDIINSVTHYVQRLYFNANSSHQLKIELLNFARKQNIAMVTIKNIFHHIKLWLKDHPGGFMVLDNCNKEKLLDFIPDSGWHVLITTNQTSFKCYTVPVAGMREQESSKLLATVSSDKDINKRLAQMVNHQPLYLGLLCAYLRSHNNDILVKATELLKHCEKNKGASDRSIKDIIKIIFDRFQSLDHYAMQLLHDLAYLNGTKISHLLVKILITSGDTIKENTQFSLITTFLKNNNLIYDIGNETFYIHPGFQDLLRKETQANKPSFIENALLNVEAGKAVTPPKSSGSNNYYLIRICQKLFAQYQFEKSELCYYEFVQQLKPHIKTLFSHANVFDYVYVQLLRMLADAYGVQGNFFRQIKCLSNAMNIVDSDSYKSTNTSSEANIQKAFVYLDFVKAQLSFIEQFRHRKLLLKAKEILFQYSNYPMQYLDIVKVEVEIYYIASQLNFVLLNKPLDNVNNALSQLPYESFERAILLRKIFRLYPIAKQEKLLQAVCTIYENSDHLHPDLLTIYKNLYVVERIIGERRTALLEHAVQIIFENSDFTHCNLDTLIVFTYLINDYFTTLSNVSVSTIEEFKNKIDFVVKQFKHEIKKLQHNLLQLTNETTTRTCLPQWLVRDETLRFNSNQFANASSLKNNSFNNALLDIIKNINDHCLAILGPSPCEFIFIVLGSLSYGLAIKKSDLESALVIFPNAINQMQRYCIDSYFQCYLRLFELFFKTIFVRMDIYIDHNVSPTIKHNKTKQKYYIDGFYGTPKEIIERHCRLTPKTTDMKGGNSKVSFYQLLNPYFLYGKIDFFKQFIKIIYEKLHASINNVPFYRAYAFEQQKLHRFEFIEAYDLNDDELNEINDLANDVDVRSYLTKIKKMVFHPLVFMIFDLALEHDVLLLNRETYRTIFEIINALLDKAIISKKTATILEEAICVVTNFRDKVTRGIYTATTIRMGNFSLEAICQAILLPFSEIKERALPININDPKEYIMIPARSTSAEEFPLSANPLITIEFDKTKPSYEQTWPALNKDVRMRQDSVLGSVSVVTSNLITRVEQSNDSLDDSNDDTSDLLPAELLPEESSPEMCVNQVREFPPHDDDSLSISSDCSDSLECLSDYWNINEDELIVTLNECYYNGTINLNYTKINDVILEDIVCLIEKYSKPVYTLLLKGNQITDASMDLLCNLIENTSISGLDLKDNHIYNDNFFEINEALKRNAEDAKINSAIRYALNRVNKDNHVLNLRHICMGDKGALYLATQLLLDKEQYQHITEISLGPNKIGNTGAKSLIEMQVMNRNLRKITWLNGSLASSNVQEEFVNIAKQRRRKRVVTLLKPQAKLGHANAAIPTADISHSDDAFLDIVQKKDKQPQKNTNTNKQNNKQKVHRKSKSKRDDFRKPKDKKHAVKPLSAFANRQNVHRVFADFRNFSEETVIYATDHYYIDEDGGVVLTNLSLDTKGTSLSETGSDVDQADTDVTIISIEDSDLDLDDTDDEMIFSKRVSAREAKLNPSRTKNYDEKIAKEQMEINLIKNRVYHFRELNSIFFKKFMQKEKTKIKQFNSNLLTHIALPTNKSKKTRTVVQPNYKLTTKNLCQSAKPVLTTQKSEQKDRIDVNTILRVKPLGKDLVWVKKSLVLRNDFFIKLNHYIADYKRLDLTKLSISDEELYLIAQSLRTNTTLIILSLQLKRFTEKGIKHLATALVHNFTLLGIRFVNAENDVNSLNNTLISLTKFINPISISRSSYNYFCTGSFALMLSQIFRNYNGKEDIDLSNFLLGDDGAKLLAGYLRNLSCTIPTLNLENNYITDKGAEEILQALKLNSWSGPYYQNLKIEKGNDISIRSKSAIERQNLMARSHALFAFNFESEYLHPSTRAHMTIGVKPRDYSYTWGRYIQWFFNSDLMWPPPSIMLDISYIYPMIIMPRSPSTIFKPLTTDNEIRRKKEAQLADRQVYQKNIRSSFFYNTSGRKTEHHHQLAPAKPNIRTGKQY